MSLSFPIIQHMKNDLIARGALGALMAGAGLSVAGFFADYNSVQKAQEQLKSNYRSVLISQIL